MTSLWTQFLHSVKKTHECLLCTERLKLQPDLPRPANLTAVFPHIAHETAICPNLHNSSNCNSSFTRQLGYIWKPKFNYSSFTMKKSTNFGPRNGMENKNAIKSCYLIHLLSLRNPLTHSVHATGLQSMTSDYVRVGCVSLSHTLYSLLLVVVNGFCDLQSFAGYCERNRT